MAFVLDASTALAWHFEDEASPAAEAVAQRAIEEGIAVPQHWLLEIASALLRGERRQRTSREWTAAFLDRLLDLEAEIDAPEPERIVSAVLPLARLHRLSVYDAAYLELAARRGLALATLDAAMAAAAELIGVEVIGDRG